MDATASSTSSVDKIPICKVNAGPRSPEWPERLKEEYLSLIDYISHNKKNDKDWFNLESNKEGTEWKGRCWYIHEMKNVPKFGIAHALALGLGPWLAAEIPYLVDAGVIASV